MDTPKPIPRADDCALLKPLVAMRLAVTGALMGLANLVPGVSGGTMVLVMGFYDDFVNSIADATRLRFTKRNVVFLAILLGVAALSFVSCAGLMHGLVANQRAAMYSLFVGLTLGGMPLMYRMTKPLDAKSMVLVLVGLLMMIGIAVTKSETPTEAERPADTTVGEFSIEPAYGLDLLAGVLGVSAMVLPGISGAYMLLVIGRYEALLAAIAAARRWAFSGGSEGDTAWLGVLIPVAIGVIISVVTLSNLLKWLLRRHEKPTLAFLMGVLLGSVVGIWPFEGETTGSAYLAGGVLAAIGFAVTFGLSRRTAQGTT
jgi:putative membrane protein